MCIMLGGVNVCVQNVDLGMVWYYSVVNMFNVGYIFSKYEGVCWNQFSLGNVYVFFKCMQVYVQGIYQCVVGDVKFVVINGVGVVVQCN